ncbi:MAG TPA: type IV toxin-antitoxin system AbiEi family antitoxin domain-containing protein [Solirubrobacteraceae bacterium]|nr:type IV toxin-antitoxin system AbiEi family antitoxin domain-containing protein [Solirubrobacteraceae bacterium]
MIDRRIGTVAAKQYGNITRGQLLDLGLTPNDIQYRLRVGRLHPVFRGVYAVGSPARLPLQRAAAAVLACGPHATLAGGSSMTGWGFWRRWVEPFEVALTEGDRRIPGIRIHRPRNLTVDETRDQLGIRMTSPARTLLDLAARRTDRQFKRDVNNALHSIYLTKGALVDLIERHPNHPATNHLLYFVTTAGGPTLSDWERMLPAFCAAQQLPAPVMGVPKAGHTPDASWPELNIVLELDSWEYHNTHLDFDTDRERDLDYHADGLLPIRITWELMIHQPDRTGAKLRKTVALRAQSQRRAA